MNILKRIKMNMEQRIWELVHDESGMGVVEIILITIVLVGLVIIFKKQITNVVNDILSKMSGQANQV